MIDAEELMYQAAMTAEVYAREGVKVYQDVFGAHPSADPKAAAIFLSGFMRTAAHDFDTGIREQAK